MGKEQDLLDQLAERAGCSFLSDLSGIVEKGDRNRLTAGLRALQELDAAAYSLREWNQALRYLADLPAQMDAEAAKTTLSQALMRKLVALE